MRTFFAVFIAVVSFIHICHISQTLGAPATTEAPANTTNGTTDTPMNGTTEAPMNGTTEAPINGTTEAPSNGTTEAPSTNGTTEGPTTNGTTEGPTTNGTTEGPTTNGTTSPLDTTTADRTTSGTTAKPSGSSGRKFDGLSFFGGILLVVGLAALAFVGYKIYTKKVSEGYKAM